MTDITLLNDDGSVYEPKYGKDGKYRDDKPDIPFAPGTPGMILVGLSDKPQAMPLHKLPAMLSKYVNKFPAMIQTSDKALDIALCVWDEEQNVWVRVTKDMLSADSRRSR